VNIERKTEELSRAISVPITSSSHGLML